LPSSQLSAPPAPLRALTVHRALGVQAVVYTCSTPAWEAPTTGAKSAALRPLSLGRTPVGHTAGG